MIEVKMETGMTSTNKVSGSTVIKTDGSSSQEEISRAVEQADKIMKEANNRVLEERKRINELLN